jgi:hypothetical protein
MLGLEWSSGRKAVRDRRLQALCSFVQVLEDLIQDIHGGASHCLIGSSSFTKKVARISISVMGCCSVVSFRPAIRENKRPS